MGCTTRRSRGCVRRALPAALLPLLLALAAAGPLLPGPAVAADAQVDACAPLHLDLRIGGTGDLLTTCAPGTPLVRLPSGPARVDGLRVAASDHAVGTFTATLAWPGSGTEQQLTVEVLPAIASASLPTPQCSRAGSCDLAPAVRRPTTASNLVVVVERLVGPGSWRSYELLPIQGVPSPLHTRVAAGTYRARLVLSPHALHLAARSPWRVFSIQRIFDAAGTWPVLPRTEQHLIRNGFMDARGTNYHHGVDIFLDDAHPEQGAPAWSAHRVYAVAPGIASYQVSSSTSSSANCSASRTAIGEVIYYHVVPTVRAGAIVGRGDQIGWSCRGRWHIHITRGFGPNPRNPVLPGASLLRPYADDEPPVVEELAPWTPCDGRWRPWHPSSTLPLLEGIAPCGRRLDPGHVAGLVDMRFVGFDFGPRFDALDAVPWMEAPTQPYRVTLRVERVRGDGSVARTLVDRTVFQADSLKGQAPFTVHWAPGFRRWAPLYRCARFGDAARCAGRFWFRAFAASGNRRYWDTTAFADGRYRVSVFAWDVAGRRGQQRTYVTLENGARARAGRPKPRAIEQPDPPEGPVLPHGSFLDADDERGLTREGRAAFGALGVLDAEE